MTTQAAELVLHEIAAPLMVCSGFGVVDCATPAAQRLLRDLAILDAVPGPLPADLWKAISAPPAGEAVEWRPPTDPDRVLGCSRYPYLGGHLVLVKEVSAKQVALSRRLHQQRLESIGRLVASVAHELRNAVAAINYSADYLSVGGNRLTRAEIGEAIEDILMASSRLQRVVDGLLDFAKLGPALSVPVSVSEVLTRLQGFLRALLRHGNHVLESTIGPDAEWVEGNTIVIEQIFVNLIMNAIQFGSGPRTVRISSTRESDAEDGDRVCVRVRDDGPGIPQSTRANIFRPFYSTRPDGTGLGLTNAREAAQSMGGEVQMEDSDHGACFAVHLRAAEPQEAG